MGTRTVPHPRWPGRKVSPTQARSAHAGQRWRARKQGITGHRKLLLPMIADVLVGARSVIGSVSKGAMRGLDQYPAAEISAEQFRRAFTDYQLRGRSAP
jgi:hypothetical protein